MDKKVYDMLLSSWTAMNQQNFHSASQFANEALEIGSDLFDVHLQLGNIGLVTDRFDEAHFHYLKAQELDPRSNKPDYNLALAYQRKRNKQQEMHCWTSAAGKEDGHIRAVAHGVLAFEAKQYKQALGFFSDALLWEVEELYLPYAENPWIYYMMGKSLFNLKQFADAEQYFERAEEGLRSQLPLQPRVYYLLGRTKWHLGKNKEARCLFEHAVQLLPEYRDAWMGLVRTEMRLGLFRAAYAHFLRVLELSEERPHPD
ncbi:MAG: tetratricopeptide repeat protein [Armatimonadota bacterium]